MRNNAFNGIREIVPFTLSVVSSLKLKLGHDHLCDINWLHSLSYNQFNPCWKKQPLWCWTYFRKCKIIFPFYVIPQHWSLHWPPCDAMQQHRIWSTLVQIMAWCLTTPSHYLNQYRLIVSDVLWHSPEGNLTGKLKIDMSLKMTNSVLPWHLVWKLLIKFYLSMSQGQWVNSAV